MVNNYIKKVKNLNQIIKKIKKWNKRHLNFEEKKHEYKIDDQITKSVSYFIRPFKAEFQFKLENDSKFKKMINKAAKRGTKIHKETEKLDYLYIAGEEFSELKKIKWNKNIKRHLTSYVNHQEQFFENHILITIELPIYSHEFNICGTIDRLYLNINTGKIILLDIKSGRGNSINWYQQVVYKRILKEWNIEVDEMILLSLWQDKKNNVIRSAKVKKFTSLSESKKNEYSNDIEELIIRWITYQYDA